MKVQNVQNEIPVKHNTDKQRDIGDAIQKMLEVNERDTHKHKKDEKKKEQTEETRK